MREQLIAYLLDELSAEERAQVELLVQQDPQWYQEFAQLKSCFEECTAEPLGEVLPPQDLTSRTCHLVSKTTSLSIESDHLVTPASSQTATNSKQHFTSKVDSPNKTPYWSMVDLILTSSILATLGMMLLPALYQSQEASRQKTCRNNLQQVGKALIEYAIANGRTLPQVAPHENAGIFAVKLIQNGQVRRLRLGTLLICPSSPMAKKVFLRTSAPCVPTPEQLASAQKLAKARPQKLFFILQRMSGSYAYRLGFYQQNQYYSIPLTERSDSPMLADAPIWQADGSYQTFHGGVGARGGSNVLTQNLSAKFISHCKEKYQSDKLFLNNNFKQAAGSGPLDVVLGRSEIRPDGNHTLVSWP